MRPRSYSASALLRAPAHHVYAVIADYRDGHPRILPKPPFVSLEVERGGFGAGTEIRVGMRVLGRDGSFRSVVSEPEPGRVLVETNDNGYSTVFTVEPRDGGRHAHVTFETLQTGPDTLPRRLELWLLGRLMRPVYGRELRQLEEVAGERAAAEIVASRRFGAPREAVFRALTDPELLARWWGPEGFTNRIDAFDPRPGGEWRLVMLGPDGSEFALHKRFEEVDPPSRLVLRHLDPTHGFRMEMTLDPEDGGTRLTWRFRFDDPAEAERVREPISAANEQNFDRLERELRGAR